MSRLTEILRRGLLPEFGERNSIPWIRPGLYHFQRESNGEHMRYHLRVDEGEPCVLIAAASEAIFLSRAGATIAKALLEGRTPERVARSLPIENVQHIVDTVAQALNGLGRSSVRYPIFNLLDPAVVPQAWKLSAPFQADVEVADRVLVENLLGRLWEARIPHVRFWITPRTDRQGLIQLVQSAEDLGMIAGVRCPSARWLRPEWIERVAIVGLDYLVLPWGIDRDKHDHLYGRGDWDLFQERIPMILQWEMTPVASVGLVHGPHVGLPNSLGELNRRGIRHLEIFAVADRTSSREPIPSTENELDDRAFNPLELRQVAGWIEDLADSRHMQIVWLPPHDCPLGETWSAVVRRGPRCGGDVSIRVDAEGNVYAPRGPARSAGNLLTDDWPEIWSQPAFSRFRGQATESSRCQECTGSAVCAVGCPSDSITWVL